MLSNGVSHRTWAVNYPWCKGPGRGGTAGAQPQPMRDPHRAAGLLSQLKPWPFGHHANPTDMVALCCYWGMRIYGQHERIHSICGHFASNSEGRVALKFLLQFLKLSDENLIRAGTTVLETELEEEPDEDVKFQELETRFTS